MLLQWQKDFEMGHPPTDAEHREVIDLLNELDVCLTAGAASETVDRALEALAHLLARHLEADEAAVPVVNRVRDLHHGWRRGTGGPNRGDLRALAHWWLTHVCSGHAATTH